MNRRILIILLFFPAFIVREPGYSQSRESVVMFFNTENYFDPFDDSLKLDNEFTPEGSMHWTWKRFQQKANHLYKVFMAAGEWDPPDLIGLAEVENYWVLHYLIKETPFGKFDYGIVHYESPDRRGIDVALLYRKKHVRVLSSRVVPVFFPDHPEKKTRDILSVLLVSRGDTLSCFVNHWPSRRGGYLESEPYRLQAARSLKQAVDSVRNVEPLRKILIMGDFNDEPSDSSLLLIKSKENLINFMEPMFQKKDGTLYFGRQWWMFDQFLVSKNLAESVKEVQIFRPAFLLDRDKGEIPLRTYSGMRYFGGFSDHLPVLLKLSVK